jgi:hypothetical protein
MIEIRQTERFARWFAGLRDRRRAREFRRGSIEWKSEIRAT